MFTYYFSNPRKYNIPVLVFIRKTNRAQNLYLRAEFMRLKSLKQKMAYRDTMYVLEQCAFEAILHSQVF